MTPEGPRRVKLSVKPDVYSFGIIVLEILTGTRARGPDYMEHMMTPRQFVSTNY